MGHRQLGAADTETGLAMRALGDETVGHAAIRSKRKAILLDPLSFLRFSGARH
jgi:hypothetical protein